MTSYSHGGDWGLGKPDQFGYTDHAFARRRTKVFRDSSVGRAFDC
jgi:hypothetical protein